MGKYEPLGQFLKKQKAERLRISFSDIEKLLGSELPKSSKVHRAWWSNNPSNNVMTREWLDAGYETEQVDVAAERLVFRRVAAPAHRHNTTERAPIFGCLKGMAVFESGYDLTEPTGNAWLNGIIGGLELGSDSKL